MITYETKIAQPETLRSAITYKTKDMHPGTLPFATIHLCGILCLSFDGANKCTVGVNKVDHRHKWNFSIQDNKGNVIRELKEGDSLAKEFHINVRGGATGGAYVYNGKSLLSIPTADEQRFDLEGSWIDLEGPRGHNKPVKNNDDTLWPRFYINEGLFCASQLSMGMYALKDSNHEPLIKPLDKVAVKIVADIFLDQLNPDSKIEIKLPNERFFLENKGNRYQIYITNEIDPSFVEPIEPDFHLTYRAFSGAFDGSKGKMKTNDQFHLVALRRNMDMTESAVAQTGDSISLFHYDKVPCMGAALGQTRAFN